MNLKVLDDDMVVVVMELEMVALVDTLVVGGHGGGGRHEVMHPTPERMQPSEWKQVYATKWIQTSEYTQLNATM